MKNTIYGGRLDDLNLNGLCGQTDRVTKIRVKATGWKNRFGCNN